MKPNKYSGKFIVFEGIEGSGKTTQVQMLAEWMANNGHKALPTREPTKDLLFGKLALSIYQAASVQNNLWGEFNRLQEGQEYQDIKSVSPKPKLQRLEEFESLASKIFRGENEDVAKLLQIIITLDRHDHLIKVITPALQAGAYVISDRYFASTPAYSAANGLDWRPFFDMQYEICGEEFLRPDLMIYIDIDPKIGLERTYKKQVDRKEYFDSLDRQINVRRAYLELFDEPRINSINLVKLDGAEAPEKIHEKVWEIIQGFL
ncbi:MAG: hypothetical protein HYW91_02990 [Candidatus Sungbacteria bacterium]|nr:hypothetical protein [Candidatus Sungbacteria bacterium]